MSARPTRATVEHGPLVADLVDALSDDECVVVRAVRHPDCLEVTVATHGVSGVLRWVGALQAIEANVKMDDPLDLRVWPDWFMTFISKADQHEFADWAFFGLNLQASVCKDPEERLLRNVVDAVRGHRRMLAKDPFGADDEENSPGPVCLAEVAPDLQPLVAAFAERDVVVLRAERPFGPLRIDVATRGSRGVRRLAESLHRIEERVGRSTESGVDVDCDLLWKRSAPHAGRMALHPGWLVSEVTISASSREDVLVARLADVTEAVRELARKGGARSLAEILRRLRRVALDSEDYKRRTGEELEEPTTRH